jgi:hypothetical protein
MEKENRKGIRKSREKEKEKAAQPTQLSQARPRARASATPDRRTPPVSGSSPSRAPSFSRSLPSGADLSAPVTSPARSSLSLSLSRGSGPPVIEPLPRASLFSLSAPWASPVSFALSARRRGPAHAHSRTSPGFSATTPTLASSSLLRAPPMPRAHPSPSRSFTFSHALPSPPAAAGDLRQRPRPSSSPKSMPSLPELRPEVKHPSSCPISLIAPCVRPISPSPVLGRGGPPCSHGGRLI